MPDIASVLLGAIVGGLFSLVATRLTLRGRTDYFDDLALKHLRDVLRKDKNTPMDEMFSWGKTIGMTEVETKQLIFIARSKLGQRALPDAEKVKESSKRSPHLS